MTGQLEWTFTDGWILMSVFVMHGESGASLDEVIRAADAMNHAKPTKGELSRSFSRLAACGILTVDNGRFRIAATHLPLLAKANKGKGGLFSTPDKGRKWLTQMQFEVDESIRVSGGDTQLSEAFDEYRKHLKR